MSCCLKGHYQQSNKKNVKEEEFQEFKKISKIQVKSSSKETKNQRRSKEVCNLFEARDN